MNRYDPAIALRASLCSALLVCTFTSAAIAQTVPAPWAARDIGSPALAGSANHDAGVFTVHAAGVDIWNSSDQFHYVYQQISGDVEVIARVDDLAATDEWSKAGVMIRASLNAGSAHGYALVAGTNGVHFQRRVASGAMSASTPGATSRAPVWVRAVREGTRITTFRSTDGTSWTTIGSDTVALGTSAYVGIAVTSHNAAARTTARVSRVVVRPLSVPPPQQSRDIGAPAVAGSAAFAAGSYRIVAGGRDIWDTSDQFHFVYQAITGNVELVARVASITYANMWAKGGVMIRESLAAESRHAMMVTTPAAGHAFQRRHEPGTYSTHTSGGVGTAPVWVRLVRTGNLFEAYRSADGAAWARVGSDTIPMGETVYVGLAATSHNVSSPTTVVIDSYRMNAAPTAGNQPPAVSITAPAAGAQFTAPATVTISATASDPESRMASADFYAGSTFLARDTTAPYSISWSAAGTYALTAIAHDADGGSTTSSAVTVSVAAGAASATATPRAVAFTASADHATSVTSYLFEVFANSANPATATALATSDLGKPTPAWNGAITVDRQTFFNNLAPGTYVSTVTAIGPGGRTRSGSVTFSR